MPQAPELVVNGVNLANNITHSINWQKTTPALLAPAARAQGAISRTFGGPVRQEPLVQDFLPKRFTIEGRLEAAGTFLGKHEALEALARVLNRDDGNPSTLRIGSLSLQVRFGEVQPVDDPFLLLPGVLTYRVSGEAVPGTFFGEYGWAVGAAQGIIVSDDRVDSSNLIFSGNSITLVNPGTAPTFAALQVTNTSYASTTVYLQEATGRRVPITLDSTGWARVDELSGIVLQTGSNALKWVDRTGALLASGTFKTSFYGTRWRFVGNAGDRFSDAHTLRHHRTGSATYVNTAGSLVTAGDGQARVGLPWVVRRNGLKNSENLLGEGWLANGATVTSAGYKYQDSNVFTLTQSSALNDNYYRQNLSHLGFSVTSGSTVVVTFLASIDTGTVARLVHDNSGIGIFINARFNLSDGTTSIPSQIGATCSAGMVSQGDGWWKCSLVITYNVTPQTSSGPGFSANNSGSSNSVKICKPQIELGSTATPYQPTNATGVDLTHPLNGAGLVLEASSANLFTLNQSSVETDASGFSLTYSDSGVHTLTRDTTTAWDGSACLKFVAGNLIDYRGFITTPSIAVANGQAVTVSAYVKGSGRLRYSVANGGGQILVIGGDYDLTSSWQRVTATYQNTSGATVNCVMHLAQYGSTTPITIYADGMQFEKLPYASSWMLGGTSRSGDVVGLVPRHNLLTWSEGLDNAAWSVLSATLGAKIAGPDGFLNAWTLNSASSTGRLEQVIDVSPGIAYTLSAWLKAAASRAYSMEYAWLNAEGTTIGGSRYVRTVGTAWQRHSITTIAPQGAVKVRCRFFGGDRVTGANVDIAMPQCVKGGNPGEYVRTTSTPVLPPDTPVLDPAWQQNGGIEFDLVLPPLSENENYGVFGSRGTANYDQAAMVLWRYSGFTKTQDVLYCERTTAAVRRSPGSVPDVYTTGKNRVKITWTNYIVDGKREMWHRVYKNGVLTYELELGRSGQNAWAYIEPSTLVSGGENFAVVSNVTPFFPELPAGAVPAV